MQYRLIVLTLDPGDPPIPIGALLCYRRGETFPQLRSLPYSLTAEWALEALKLRPFLLNLTDFHTLPEACDSRITLSHVCEIPADADAEAYVRELLRVVS